MSAQKMSQEELINDMLEMYQYLADDDVRHASMIGWLKESEVFEAYPEFSHSEIYRAHRALIERGLIESERDHVLHGGLWCYKHRAVWPDPRASNTGVTTHQLT